MTSDRKPRVDLDPLNHRLLIAEATKRGIRPKALLTKLIEEAASPKAKGFDLEKLLREIDSRIESGSTKAVMSALGQRRT